jgi:hypothetical protein
VLLPFRGERTGGNTRAESGHVLKAPNPKLQTPNKLQIPNSNPHVA